MKYKVRYTQRAINDLDSIYEYISFSLSEATTAALIVNQIRSEIRKLNEMPMRFKVYDNEPWKSQGLRCFNVKNYIVFYLPNEDDKTVSVVSIMYGGRNLEEQLTDVQKLD